MPTVHRFDDLRVVICPNDHVPLHVHVLGRGGEAVFKLHCPDGPVELREVIGHNKKTLVRVEAGLNSILASVCQKWREIHVYY